MTLTWHSYLASVIREIAVEKMMVMKGYHGAES
jgi:hypothetical protein